MVSSTNYAGAMDEGGYIAEGRYARVAEKRPEIVSRERFVAGPAYVTSGADTARMMGGGGQGNVTINAGFSANDAVHNYFSSSRGERTLNLHISRNGRFIASVTGAGR
jgi:hypothetical protein